MENSQENISVNKYSLADLRVVLLADEEALRSYGPVLRRLAVGLMDEVGDLSMLYFGTSSFLKYVPCPPVRLITEIHGYWENPLQADSLERKISIPAPRFTIIDKLRPHRHIQRLTQALKPIKPTLLHALTEKQVGLTRNLSNELGIPYVVSLLTSGNVRLNVAEKYCSQILPWNSSLARQIRKNHPNVASRIHLLPMGTHVSTETSCFATENGKAKIFCSSPFRKENGLNTLIQAVKKLSDQGLHAYLLLSGQGPAERDLRRQVNQLELSGWVHFIPPIETIVSGSDAYKTVLSEMDIFVQPWPLHFWRPELLEAISAGNAVVVADDGQENDLVIHEKTALLFPHHNQNLLTKILAELLTNHNYARDLAQNSQDYLRKHFLASKMVSHLAQAYHRALENFS